MRPSAIERKVEAWTRVINPMCVKFNVTVACRPSSGRNPAFPALGWLRPANRNSSVTKKTRRMKKGEPAMQAADGSWFYVFE